MMKLNIEVRNPLFKITYHCLAKISLALIPTSNEQKKRIEFWVLCCFANSYCAPPVFLTLAKIRITCLILIFKLGMLQNQNKQKDEQLKGKKNAWEIWV